LGARIGIALGIFSFLFATYTAVTGPVLLPKEDEASRERMAQIQASLPAETEGGCCAKKEEQTTAHANCSHAGCSHAH
ncbi:MAG: hypothetical protein ACXW32_03815, partial [Limisphaerales bacterium]